MKASPFEFARAASLEEDFGNASLFVATMPAHGYVNEMAIAPGTASTL